MKSSSLFQVALRERLVGEKPLQGEDELRSFQVLRHVNEWHNEGKFFENF